MQGRLFVLVALMGAGCLDLEPVPLPDEDFAPDTDAAEPGDDPPAPDDDTPTEPPVGPEDDTASDTAGGGSGGGGGGGGGGAAFPLEYFTFALVFGFDPVAAQAVPVLLGGQPLGPQLELRVGSLAYFQGTAPSESCILVFTSPSARPAAALPAAGGALFGYQNEIGSLLSTDCGGLVPQARINAFEIYVQTQSSWAGGVHPLPFDPGVAALITPLQGIAVPGGVTDPQAQYQYDVLLGFTYGFRVDEGYEVQVDPAGDLVAMTDAELVADGALTRGLYVVASLYAYPAPP